MEKYFFYDGQEQKGPLSFEEINERKLSGDTLLWKEGTPNWKPIKEFEEFKNELEISSEKQIQKKGGRYSSRNNFRKHFIKSLLIAVAITATVIAIIIKNGGFYAGMRNGEIIRDYYPITYYSLGILLVVFLISFLILKLISNMVRNSELFDKLWVESNAINQSHVMSFFFSRKIFSNGNVEVIESGIVKNGNWSYMRNSKLLIVEIDGQKKLYSINELTPSVLVLKSQNENGERKFIAEE